MPYYADSGARFAGLFDSITNIAQAIIPPKTIVGQLLGGNTTGAAVSTAHLVTATTTGGAGGGSTAPAPVRPATSPGLFAPGGFVQRNQTALLLVAAGLVVVIAMRKKGRK